MAEGREVGTVKWFDPGRGYGFIARAQGGDAYVHMSEVERAGLSTLDEGETISFTVRKTPRGFQAENLAREQAPARRQLAPTGTVSRLTTQTDFKFSPDYLCEGYFEEKNGKAYPRAEILDKLAMDVARLLGNQEMRSAQLRRFFNKARGIESKLDRVHDFEEIKADIYGFKRDVAYQVGRGVVPEAFQQFIERNVALAVEDEASFRKGFLQHFESVLAYFVYFFRNK